MSKLAKLSQLFDTGKELVLPANDGQSEVVWISKLNTFQTEECAHEGRVARSRKIFAIKEVGTPEYDLFQVRAASAGPERLIDALIESKASEFLYEAFQDIRSDELWRDKIEVMEHSDDDIAERPADDPERTLLDKIAAEYQDEILKRVTEARDDYRAELKTLPPNVLQERHLEAYVEQEGLKAFQATRQTHELYHCLRECEAKAPPEGQRWDHSKCDHSRRYLDSPAEVQSLPDEVLTTIREAYQNLIVPTDVARFTAGPASSSESSGPSTSAEGSQPSSPEAPSQTPATTS